MKYLYAALAGAATTVVGIFAVDVAFNGVSESIENFQSLTSDDMLTFGVIAGIGTASAVVGAKIAS